MRGIKFSQHNQTRNITSPTCLYVKRKPDRFASAWRLRKRLQDKPKVSFTDLTSMIVNVPQISV